MTKIKIYCDKCGIELSQMQDYEDIDIEIAHYLKNVDLCASCFEKLTNVIEIFFNKESESKGEGK